MLLTRILSKLPRLGEVRIRPGGRGAVQAETKHPGVLCRARPSRRGDGGASVMVNAPDPFEFDHSSLYARSAKRPCRARLANRLRNRGRRRCVSSATCRRSVLGSKCDGIWDLVGQRAVRNVKRSCPHREAYNHTSGLRCDVLAVMGLKLGANRWRAGSRGPGGEAVGVGKRRLRATGGHRRPKKGLSTSQDWSLAFPGTRASASFGLDMLACLVSFTASAHRPRAAA